MFVIIGRLAIAMSRHYWDEYLNFNLDKAILNSTLKFHQANISYRDIDVEELSDDDKMMWIECTLKECLYSDVMLKIYDYTEIKDGIKLIYDIMRKNYKDVEYKLSMPIMSIYNKEYGVESGHYSFNFGDMKLIKYKELSKIDEGINCKSDIVLGFFLSIEKAIVMYGGSGYEKALQQIGYISYRTYLDLKEQRICINKIYEQKQKFTHYVGLNVRRQLCTDIYQIRVHDIFYKG